MKETILEEESVELYREILKHEVSGPWDASEPEQNFKPVRQYLIEKKGLLSNFRRNCLSAGRLNFPDTPVRKERYLMWDEDLWNLRQNLSRMRKILRMVRMLLLNGKRFGISDLEDNGIGNPTPIRVPFISNKMTEVKLRSFYYQSQIKAAFGNKLGNVLEIGGGYGALAGELIQRLCVKRYFAVEFPDTLALCYFYLKSLLGGGIRIIYQQGSSFDQDAQVFLMAPWMLPHLNAPIDLTINTMSFQHMNEENLKFYFGQIDRLRSHWIYLVNRNVKRDPTDVPIDRYPIPSVYEMKKDSDYLFTKSKPGWLRERVFQIRSGQMS